MLTMAIVILATCGLDKMLNIKPTLDFNPGLKLTIILFVVTTIFFWVISATLTKRKPDAYEKLWDEVPVKIFNVIQASLVLLLMLAMTYNYKDNVNFLTGTKGLWAFLAITDIIGIGVAYNTYSFKVKESIIDSLLLQIRNVRAAVLMMVLVVLIKKFTIFGVLILFVFVATIPGLYTFIKKVFFGAE